MISRTQDNPRRAAYDILLRVADGAFSDMVLDSTLSRSDFAPRDRRLVTELVYGILRLRGKLDFALTPFCDRPLERLQPEVLWLLRLGAYQLLELDRIPPHAAVSTTVELARELRFDKATRLVNAVLRSLVRGRSAIVWPEPRNIRPYLQQVCSLPAWLSKELMRGLPNVEAQAFGESLAAAPPLALRVNRLKQDPDIFLDALIRAGHEARPCRYAPEGVIVEKRGETSLPGDAEGWYQVQDEASMLIAHLLDPEPGQRILDACAAPGSKTTHLAALTGNRAKILALDKYPSRVETLRRGVQRLGCQAIEAREWDLINPPDFLEPGSFERVLVDAPCSGLGVIRRNPEGRWNKTAANLRELAELQRRILDNVAPLVSSGGLLVYSLCTFSHCETDGVLDAFLAEHPEFRPEAPDSLPEHWSGLFDERGTLHSYPHRHDGMDAFFAARLRRE